MADTNYLYYGDQEIEQQALMDSLANEVNNYVASKSWSKKKKERFMSAYSDMINRGLKGASNNSGVWMVDFGGDDYIDQNTWDDKQREAYEAAATFIHKQMSGLPTRSSQEQTKEDKKELTKFKNRDFVSSFTNRLVNDWFGGNATNYSNQWNDYDERGENGLRGINQRAGMLATSLRKYLNSLKDDQYDFADSPFTDVNDFKTKIQTAIDTLESDNKDLNQIKKSLNVIGLNADEWFNNGSGDTYVDEYGRTVAGSDGKPLSYAQYYNNLALQEKTKQENEQKAAEEKQKALDALQIYTSKPTQKISSLIDLSNKYKGDLNQAIANYQNINLNQLTQEQNDELVSLFQGGYNQNALDDINDDEWEQIKTKVATNGEDRSQYRKIEGINGIYYDVAKKHLFQLGNFQQTNNKNFLSGLSDKERKDAEQQRLIFEGSGLSGADIADIAATFTDLAGIGASFIPVVGNVAGAATGAAGSLTHFGADWSRDGLDWGDVKRLGVNLAFDAATLIPGFGTAAKAGKIAKFLAPKVPYIIAGIGAVQGLSNGTEIINSFKKLSNPSTVTVEDLQNMAQGIALLAGGVNVSRGIYQSRQAKKNLKPAISSEPATIETRNGRTLELNESEYNTLNSKTATREAKQAAVESAATRSGTPLDATDGISYKGRSLTHPLRGEDTSIEVEGLTAPKAATQGVNIEEIRERNRKWIEEHPTLSRILPGRTTNSKINWTNEGMYIRGFGENSSDTPAITSKPTNQAQQNTSTREPQYRRAVMNRYKDILSGNYSKKAVQEGTFKFNDIEVEIKKSGTGTNDIYINGKRVDSIKDLSDKEVKQHIAKLVQEHRTSVNKGKSKEQKISTKEIGKMLQELKKKGWLKQGGKITDTQIDNFFKTI